MIKRIIFDIDNTLICNIDFVPHYVEALKKYGVEDVSKVYTLGSKLYKGYEEKFTAYKRNDYLEYFSELMGVKLTDEFLNIYFEVLKKAITPNGERLKRFLDTLKDYELVLLSNYFEESQRNRLAAMGINDYFTEYHGEEYIKPHKEAYLSALGGHKPYECLMVGDNLEYDVLVPKSLGMNAIYINPNADVRCVEDITLSMIKRYK